MLMVVVCNVISLRVAEAPNFRTKYPQIPKFADTNPQELPGAWFKKKLSDVQEKGLGFTQITDKGV